MKVTQQTSPPPTSVWTRGYNWIISTLTYVFLAIYHFILPLPVIPEDVPSKPKKTKRVAAPAAVSAAAPPPTLFPSISEDSTLIRRNSKTVPLTESQLRQHTQLQQDLHTPISCSTGLTTRLLPFKNDQGEIEWTFTDDMLAPGHELDAFRMDKQVPTELTKHELSPTISNSSNSSTLSQKIRKENSTTPTTTDGNTTSPFTPEIDVDDKSSISSSQGDEQSGDSPDAEGKIHHCPHCDATFKIRGYLTRHLKKHAVNKAYTCPFHKVSIYIDENNITHKCHPNGGFSRRDTYKTHLKSRHFKYPKGTKTKQRSSSSGSCSMCGEFFPNAEIWCELHVEGGECKYLPSGFKGKSRIKNRLRKQLEKNKDVDPDLLPYASRVIGEVGGGAKSVRSEIDDISSSSGMDTPFGESPSTGMSYNTPSMKSPMSYMMIPNQVNYFTEQQPQQQVQVPPLQPPQFNQYPSSISSLHGDYDDDEFCLDIDQLNNATFNNFNEIVHYVKLNQQQLQQSLQQQQQQQFPIQSSYIQMSQSPDPIQQHPQQHQSQQQQVQQPQHPQPVMMYQY
ncbi:Transcriptional regulator STP2 [Spathaspora sp. JA1]|nr:Transcriptional regulator STP2 [Spathaspora sp. JA1]